MYGIHIECALYGIYVQQFEKYRNSVKVLKKKKKKQQEGGERKRNPQTVSQIDIHSLEQHIAATPISAPLILDILSIQSFERLQRIRQGFKNIFLFFIFLLVMGNDEELYCFIVWVVASRLKYLKLSTDFSPEVVVAQSTSPISIRRPNPLGRESAIQVISFFCAPLS